LVQVGVIEDIPEPTDGLAMEKDQMRSKSQTAWETAAK